MLEVSCIVLSIKICFSLSIVTRSCIRRIQMEKMLPVMVEERLSDC